MSKQNTGFRHYRHTNWNESVYHDSPTTKGGVTMAFDSPKHIADLLETDRVRVAFAFCSGADNYNRADGRKIASARLANDQTAFTVSGNEFQDMIHAEEPGDLYISGLDRGQIREWVRRVEATIPG